MPPVPPPYNPTPQGYRTNRRRELWDVAGESVTVMEDEMMQVISQNGVKEDEHLRQGGQMSMREEFEWHLKAHLFWFNPVFSANVVKWRAGVGSGMSGPIHTAVCMRGGSIGWSDKVPHRSLTQLNKEKFPTKQRYVTSSNCNCLWQL